MKIINTQKRSNFMHFYNCQLVVICNILQFRKFILSSLFLIHTIRKVKFLSKNSILTKPHHFTSFSPKFFLTIFLVKSKLSTAKKSKTTTFSRVFHPKKIDFLGKSKLNFWTKNEDFKQCDALRAVRGRQFFEEFAFLQSRKQSVS